MKTPNDYAKAAQAAANLAELIRPEPGDRYGDQANLCVYHLRAAAKLAQQIAEDIPK